jgi:gliding motility-associated-like protein
VTILPAPEVNAGASETLVEPGTEVQLSAEPQTKGVFYSWSPPEAVSDPNSSSPTAVVTEDTWFYVTASYDQGECSAIDSVLVQVRRDNECEEFNIFLPSAFTPNGDGQNDVYRVKSVIPLESMTLMIFNRWGEKVFETNDQGISWDGTYNGKPAAADAYGYYFEGICNGTTFKKQGNITIVR